jgi:hypothetical protein
MQTPQQAISYQMTRSKKLIFSTIMVLLTLLCVEGLARLAFFVMYKHGYSLNQVRTFVRRGNYGISDEFYVWWDQEIVHPYLGFVVDFKDAKRNNATYGFTTSKPPVIKREPGRLNVVILGGSVAGSMRMCLEAAFDQACRVPPNVISLGMSGYKQPQQLLALTYFLSMGAEYDLVINLDGYNEIALPLVDNHQVGINPFFPRNWNLRINRQPSKAILAKIGEVRYLRDLKEEGLDDVKSSLFKWSAWYGLIKMRQFRRLNHEITRVSVNLQALQQKERKSFEETGPLPEYQDPQQVYHDAAAVWARCSELMDQAARLNGMEYYHFLQPNQYVKGSKVLTKEELQIAYWENYEASKSAIIGYPMLIEQGKKLMGKHINFFDATMAFAQERQTVYIDVCCHYNDRGKELLTKFILDKVTQNPRLRKFFKNPPPMAGASQN